MKKIAILGATGHIGKALTHELSGESGYEVFLFSRTKEKITEFLNAKSHINIFHIHNILEFGDHKYDAIINCTGVGTPSVLKGATARMFESLDEIDNRVIKYLKAYPDALYINLSSGAVYGDLAVPVIEDTPVILNEKPETPGELYAASKVKMEMKHRKLRELNIVDLRVFAFFSRYIDLNSNFLMADVVNSIKNKTVLKTMPDDMQRDYVTQSDLLGLIKAVMKKGKINDFFDVCTKAPVSKFELLDSLRGKFGLVYEIEGGKGKTSPTGEKKAYFSLSKKAKKILGYKPAHSSLSGILEEIGCM